jgi:hypothetical protein
MADSFRIKFKNAKKITNPLKMQKMSINEELFFNNKISFTTFYHQCFKSKNSLKSTNSRNIVNNFVTL